MLAFVEPWPDVRHSLRDQPRQRETFPTERDRVSLSHSPFISRQAEIGPEAAFVGWCDVGPNLRGTAGPCALHNRRYHPAGWAEPPRTLAQ